MQIAMAGHVVLSAQNSGISTANTTAIGATIPGAAIEALSENFVLALDRFDTVNIHGGIYEPDDEAGVRRVTGELSAAAHPETIGFLIAGALQRSSTTSLTSTFFRSTFTTPTSDHHADAAVQPYTAEVFRPNTGAGTTAFRYTGMCLNTLGISFAPNQDVRMAAAFIGYNVDTITKTTPTFSNSPTTAYNFVTSSIEIAGAADATVEALNINIDNQLESVVTLNSTDKVSKIVRRGPQMVNVTGTMQFADLTNYNKFVNQTEFQLKATVSKASSHQMVIDLPRCVFTGHPQVMQGRERILVNFEAKARYHTGSATAININFTSVRSFYTN